MCETNLAHTICIHNDTYTITGRRQEALMQKYMMTLCKEKLTAERKVLWQKHVRDSAWHH